MDVQLRIQVERWQRSDGGAAERRYITAPSATARTRLPVAVDLALGLVARRGRGIRRKMRSPIASMLALRRSPRRQLMSMSSFCFATARCWC